MEENIKKASQMKGLSEGSMKMEKRGQNWVCQDVSTEVALLVHYLSEMSFEQKHEGEEEETFIW